MPFNYTFDGMPHTHTKEYLTVETPVIF